MKALLALLLLLAPAGVASAAEPILIRLDADHDDYFVPTGKVLLLESMSNDGDPYFLLRFNVGGTWHECKFGTYAGLTESGTTGASVARHYVSFPRPIKLPAGTRIQHVGDTTRYPYLLFCTLVEPSELYARVDSELQGVVVENDRMNVLLKVDTARPVRIATEGTGDLSLPFGPVAAEVEKTAPSNYVVSIPLGDATNRFFARYDVRARQ